MDSSNEPVNRIEGSPVYSFLKDGLYISQNGQLAFKVIDNSIPGEPRDRFIDNVQLMVNGTLKDVSLNQVIDTSSFSHIGDLYFSDKRYVYYHNQMLDGGTFFIIEDADAETIKVLNNSYYARDINSVFCRGGVMEKADVASFRVISQAPHNIYSWIARDRLYTYEGFDIIDSTVSGKGLSDN